MQTLAFIAVWVLLRIATSNYSVRFNYYMPAKNLLIALNYPVIAFWYCALYIFDRLHVPNVPSGVLFWVLTITVSILFLSSIALFWYFVVREVELRRRRDTLLRFPGTLVPTVSMLVFFLVGVSALVYAYMQSKSELSLVWRNGSTVGLFLVLLPDVFLVAWAIVLIWAAVSDSRRLIGAQTSVAKN
jgi:hypothetical protein